MLKSSNFFLSPLYAMHLHINCLIVALVICVGTLISAVCKTNVGISVSDSLPGKSLFMACSDSFTHLLTCCVRRKIVLFGC